MTKAYWHKAAMVALTCDNIQCWFLSLYFKEKLLNMKRGLPVSPVDFGCLPQIELIKFTMGRSQLGEYLEKRSGPYHHACM